MTKPDKHQPTALLDVNVLLALVWEGHTFHQRALENFTRVQAAWATTPLTESALLRLLLNPKVVGGVVSAKEALTTLRQLRAHPGWQFIDGNASLVDDDIDTSVLMGPRQVTDLCLVQIAKRAGAVLATFDHGVETSVAPTDRAAVRTWL